MEIRSAVQNLHQASRDEWIAARASLHSRRGEILAKVRGSLEAGDDPDRTVLPMLYRELSSERIADASASFVVTQFGETMMLGFSEGFSIDVIGRHLKVDFGQTISGAVAQSRTAMHVTDIQRSSESVSQFARMAGIRACACEPLVVGDRLFGTLCFATRTRQWFDLEDLQFFRSIAAHVAAARDRMDQAFHRRQAKLAPANA
jgi:GAF domain-containing protein